MRSSEQNLSQSAVETSPAAKIFRGVRLAVLGWLGASLCGCATGIPLPSLMSSSKDDVTGSIRGVSPLSNSLDQEDWRRAKGAMGLALDPQGSGTIVSWDNPQSKARGSFTPVGEAKAVDDKICRAFIAELGGSLKSEQLQGDACRDRSGEWNVGKVQPWKRV